MTLLAIAIFLVLQVLVSTQPVNPVIQHSEKTAVADKTRKSESDKAAVPVTVNHPAGEQQAQPQTEAAEGQSDKRIYKVQVVAQPQAPYDPLPLVSIIVNSLLALAAFGTLLVLRKQTKKLGEQVDQMIHAGLQTDSLITETENTAKAALQQAIATVNAERAWINANIEDRRFVIRNYGRTPAKILDIQIYEANMKSSEPFMAATEYDKTARLFHSKVLVPAEALEYGLEFNDLSIKAPDIVKDVYDFRRRYYVYGKIDYRDVIEPETPHITKFCLVFRPSTADWAASGPEGFNDAT